MSAPYIIPFNHQPVSTVITATTSYTVPVGKYARVNIANAILPVLDGVAIYHTTTYPSGSKTVGTSSTQYPVVASNVHRINITKDNNGDALSINFSNVAVATSFYDLQFSGIGASSSHIFPGKTDLSILTMIKTTTAATLNSITVDWSDVDEIWLMAGDVLTFNSGKIYYEEYNIIS